MTPRVRSSIVLPAVLAVTLAPLSAQVPRLSLDASLGAGGGALRAAISTWRPFIHLGDRVEMGLGARITAYTGDPASYTNRGTVQGALAPTLTIDPAVYGLNAAGFIDVQLFGGVSAGANLDLLGFAFGSTSTVGPLRKEPQGFSYFRYGSADHGALNSEFFASVRVAPRIRLRAGLSHYVTNYEVTDTGAAGSPTSRYQRFETVPFVALALRL